MWIKLLPYILGALVLGFVVYQIDSFGYHRAETKVTAKYEQMLKAALDEQIKKHNDFVEQQDKFLNQLTAENNRLEQIIKENEVEAGKDTTAKRPAVSKSSVMRLNRIR